MRTVFLICLVACGWATPAVPAEWQQRMQEGKLLYSTKPSPILPHNGNGYVASALGSQVEYISGLFTGDLPPANPVSHRAALPCSVDVGIRGQVPLGPVAVDFEYGVTYRLWSVQNQTITQRVYHHRAQKHVSVTDFTVTNAGNTALGLEFSDSFPKAGASTGDITYTAQLVPGGVCLSGHIQKPELPSGPVVQFAVCHATISNATIPPNSVGHAAIVSVRYTSLEVPSPLSAAMADFQTARTADLWPSHTQAWQDLWRSRIEVGGNSALAAVINSSFYGILSSVRKDQFWSSSPGSLSTNGYNGHTFWDVETWMWPNLLVFQPDIAEAVLRYRYNLRDGAAANAKLHNQNGLQYPWESAFSGWEVDPDISTTQEIHLNGDIAVAFKQYWMLTRNVTWLRSIGFPVLSGIADFWASRAEKRGSPYAIAGVMGPDEYHANVTNSVYTNVIAQISLRAAAEAATALSEPVNPHWTDVADNLIIPFDETNQMHPEFEGYKGDNVKQADVVLLGYPLMYDMPATVRRNDLLYYAARTPGGPAMTWSMFVVGFLDLADLSTAAKYFTKSYADNTGNPFRVWAENAGGSGCPNFITGAGGFLQAVWAGYGGIRLHNDSLAFHSPRVLPDSSSLIFRNLAFRDSFLHVSITDSAVEFVLSTDTPQAASPLYVHSPDGKSARLTAVPMQYQPAGVFLVNESA
eukprot:TRINITY_DN1089_c0_g1_i2.p1 TRINITY_DN1089_c0_g1~~TRINITY_DN1089_c0_g1_i2.p1  ORF type:complete len:694 (-),score=107.47 TRINITY_DN1089_c0_g1_i2:41-2122(-)